MQVDSAVADVLTVSQMRAAEEAVMAAGTAGFVLMQRAARAATRAIMRHRAAPATVAVLCGPGNNGGDGYGIARMLAERGYAVTLYSLVGRDALAGDARRMAELWDGLVHQPDRFDGKADIIVDALFGTGLARPLSGPAHGMIVAANAAAAFRVAVDIPSGIAGDSGAELGIAFAADLTITFHALKPGHLLFPGRDAAGEIIVADIGLDPGIAAAGVAEAGGPEIRKNDRAARVAALAPRQDGHKYSRGHALVLAGGIEGCGAARLAARAALRAGAGLVTLGVPASALLAHASRGPDSLMLRRADDLAALLEDRRRNAIVIGPAYGVGEATRQTVAAVLATGRLAVLDADALTSFADAPDALAGLTQSSGRAILTPHEGEFARLAGSLALPEGASKLARALAMAAHFSAVVVLKGPDTVIAAPDGRAAINTNAPPWLATAGSGDVLAGLIAGLGAQGLSPFDAACCGVWLHGEAGRIAGRGLIADDLPEAVRQVVRGG